jgi:uncharacterized membrane protein
LFSCISITECFYTYQAKRAEPENVSCSKVCLLRLGINFYLFFISHFVKTDDLVAMPPAWGAFRLPILYFTGIIELGIAIALLRKNTDKGLLGLPLWYLLRFFQLIFMPLFNLLVQVGISGSMYFFVRAPLQLFLIAWSYYLCLERRGKTISYE